MQIAQLINEAVSELEGHGVENSRLETELLLGHCLKMSRTQLYLHGKDIVVHEDIQKFWSLIKRRANREPYAYIVSEREFWSLPFFVCSDVLIPRPETEFLVETILQTIKKDNREIYCCIDLCCGSGVIGVVLALELGIPVTALDLSEGAVEVTLKNSVKHGVQSLVKPQISDLFAALTAEMKFPLIVSNPPYVNTSEMTATLEPEVSLFEPHLALDGGTDGLDCIRRIAVDSLHHLTEGGLLFMEFGADQGEEVRDIFTTVREKGRYFSTVKIFKDYSGRDRVLKAEAHTLNER